MAKWTLTKWIIAINCLIAIVSLSLGPENAGNWIKTYFPLTLTGLQSGQWWRILSSAWVHDDLIGYHSLHLLFNMMSLAVLGQLIESTMGRKHFCLLYFPAGILAALFFLTELYIRIHFFMQDEYLLSSLYGASGCVMGLVGAFAVMHPNRLILLFPCPFPVRAINAVAVFAIISLILLLLPFPYLINHSSGPFRQSWIFLSGLNVIAHSAHLGGLFWGLFYMVLTKAHRRPTRAFANPGPESSPDFRDAP